MSLAAHLATLRPAELAAVLDRRPDVLVEPVPRDVAELAARLNGVDSLHVAFVELDADELTVARALAITGGRSVTELSAELQVGATDVEAVLKRLAARALTWPDGDRMALPDRLAAILGASVEHVRRAVVIAREASADGVHTAVAALGGDPSGTKAQATGRLVELLSDTAAVRRIVEGLPPAVRRDLTRTVRGARLLMVGGPDAALAAAGLAIEGRYRRPELPREVAVAVLLGTGTAITGRPELARSTDPFVDGRAAAEAAVHALTGLVDASVEAPLAALKKGGIGTRERTRLGKRLGFAEPALTIDGAAVLGLLVRTSAGYSPTEAYEGWRDRSVAERWASAAEAWFAAEWAPTFRDTDDGEVAPPVAIMSMAGMVRRALLRAAADGRSLDAAVVAIGWFCPMHGYDDGGLGCAITAARREAELLGIVVGDRLTTLGERLVGSRDVAADVAGLLPDTSGTLVIQSDLSAVVAGAVSAAAARVLAAAAEPEGGGAAVMWRFSPASVRAALDAGWTAAELRDELVAVSGRELPQPLDYLIGDVARRHGTVRVRETRCCVTGSEADLSEILHTRSLAKLVLRRLAPTVLTSTAAPDALLTALRKAGFAPMAEDADGQVIAAKRLPVRARPAPTRGPRLRVAATDLAARVLSGDTSRPRSPTLERLAGLNPNLDPSELGLLADALGSAHAVRIRYRNKAGNSSVRDITPIYLWDPWITAYCHLRRAERDFAVARIEAVGPAY